MSSHKRRDHPEDEEVAVDAVASESAKAIYLVMKHGVEEPAYSVFKVDAAAAASAAAGCLRARHLIRLHASQRDMSFVAVHSNRGSWIVGVGGGKIPPPPIICDPSTHEEFRGPRPKSAGLDPVLISHRGKLYYISRRPFHKMNLDSVLRVSWFQSLNFKNGHGGFGFLWKDLVPPPFFPVSLTPRQWRNPPDVRLLSYAAVGSYILLSPEHQPGGTFGYHVGEKTWTNVGEENLPFVGEAVHLSGTGNYFAARSKASSAVAVFCLQLDESSSGPARLSVREVPVPSSEDKIPAQLLCPLGGASFCSVDLKSSSPSSSQAGALKTAQVILTTCQMNMKKNNSEAQDVIVKEQGAIYRFYDRTRFLASPMPLVAALSMDQEMTNVCEEKPRKKRAAPLIFRAPMVRMETSK